MSFVRRYSQFPIIPLGTLDETKDFVVVYRSDSAIPLSQRNARILPSEFSPWVLQLATGQIVTRTANEDVSVGTGNPIKTGSLFTFSYPTNDKMVLYFPFSEDALSGVPTTVFDRSPLGNDGTTASTAVINIAEGKYGNGLKLGATNGILVRVTDSASLSFTDLLTVECWIKPNTITVFQPIISKVQIAGASAGWSFTVSDMTNDGLRITLRDGASSNDFTGIGTIVTGQWQHVAFTLDNVGKILRVYINGLDVSPASPTVSYINAPEDLLIGARTNGAGTSDFFDGNISELKIYNRILKQEEIRTHYLRVNSSLALGTIRAEKFRIIDQAGFAHLKIANDGTTFAADTFKINSVSAITHFEIVDGAITLTSADGIGAGNAKGMSFTTGSANLGDAGNFVFVGGSSTDGLPGNVFFDPGLKIDTNTPGIVGLCGIRGKVTIGSQVTLQATAILDINTTTQGILTPRLTTGEKQFVGEPITVNHSSLTPSSLLLTMTGPTNAFLDAGIEAGSTVTLNGISGLTPSPNGVHIVNTVNSTTMTVVFPATGTVTGAGNTTHLRVAKGLVLYDTEQKTLNQHSGVQWRPLSTNSVTEHDVFTESDLGELSAGVVTIQSGRYVIKAPIDTINRWEFAVGASVILETNDRNANKISSSNSGIFLDMTGTTLVEIDEVDITLSDNAAILYTHSGGRLLANNWFATWTGSAPTGKIGDSKSAFGVFLNGLLFTGFHDGMTLENVNFVELDTFNLISKGTSTGAVINLRGVTSGMGFEGPSVVATGLNEAVFFIEPSIATGNITIDISKVNNQGMGEYFKSPFAGNYTAIVDVGSAITVTTAAPDGGTTLFTTTTSLTFVQPNELIVMIGGSHPGYFEIFAKTEFTFKLRHPITKVAITHTGTTVPTSTRRTITEYNAAGTSFTDGKNIQPSILSSAGGITIFSAVNDFALSEPLVPTSAGTWEEDAGSFQGATDAGETNTFTSVVGPAITDPAKFTKSTPLTTNVLTGDIVVHTGFTEPTYNGTFTVVNKQTNFYEIRNAAGQIVNFVSNDFAGTSKASLVEFAIRNHGLLPGNPITLVSKNYNLSSEIRSIDTDASPSSRVSVRTKFNSGVGGLITLTTSSGKITSATATGGTGWQNDELVTIELLDGFGGIGRVRATDAGELDAVLDIINGGEGYKTSSAVISEFGRWNTHSLDQTTPKIRVEDCLGVPDSMIRGGWNTDGANSLPTTGISGTYSDFVFRGDGVLKSIVGSERILLIDADSGIVEYTGKDLDVILNIPLFISATGSSNASYLLQLFVDKRDGNGFVGMDDIFEFQFNFGAGNTTIQREISKKAVANPSWRFKWMIKANSSTTDITCKTCQMDI